MAQTLRAAAPKPRKSQQGGTWCFWRRKVRRSHFEGASSMLAASQATSCTAQTNIAFERCNGRQGIEK